MLNKHMNNFIYEHYKKTLKYFDTRFPLIDLEILNNKVVEECADIANIEKDGNQILPPPIYNFPPPSGD